MRTRWLSDPLAKGKPPNPGRYGTAARIVYVARDPITALEEVQAFGLPLAHAFVPLDVQLNAVVDVHDPRIVKALSITQADLRQNFRTAASPTPTQLLGNACEAIGTIDAIAYRSLTKPKGECFAILVNSLLATKGSVVLTDPTVGAFTLP